MNSIRACHNVGEVEQIDCLNICVSLKIPIYISEWCVIVYTLKLNSIDVMGNYLRVTVEDSI